MKANQITGFVVSTALHAGLALLLLPLLWADEPKPQEPEPILLELSSFEPPLPPVIVPEPVVAPELPSEPVAELVQAAPEPPLEAKPVIEEKKPESLQPPKKEKPIELAKPKPQFKPVVQEKKPEPLIEPKPIEQPLPKPEPDPEVLQQQAQERQRLAALKEQRQREFLERQQQEQERQRLAQQQQQAQARRRAAWEQAQQREAALQRQAQAKAKAEQQARAAQAAAKPVKAESNSVVANSSNEMPVIRNPRYRSPPSPPAYPRRALEAGIEGTVLVRVTISAEGNIMAVLVHQSSGNASLDAAALKAVRSWAFMPAQRDGKAIASIVQLPVRFNLS